MKFVCGWIIMWVLHNKKLFSTLRYCNLMLNSQPIGLRSNSLTSRIVVEQTIQQDQSRTHLPLGSLSKTQLIDVMCRIDVALISYNKSVTIKVAGETKRFWQVGKMLKW
ncbi:aldo/keto reductase [Rhizophagus irregularis DAOM 181602=DAOM 197198]|nr:aldo/keto reductase [Rhizophagus irregularis DAOM 181602=DAOM 197198]